MARLLRRLLRSRGTRSQPLGSSPGRDESDRGSLPGKNPLRGRRRQREGQRLGIGAGTQRVIRRDRLLEADLHRVVGHLAVVGLQRGGRRGAANGGVGAGRRAGGLDGLRERERAVDQVAGGGRARIGDAQGGVTGGGDDVRRGGGAVVLREARGERAKRGGRAHGQGQRRGDGAADVRVAQRADGGGRLGRVALGD